MDPRSVITLGHMVNVPLIGSSSDLSDGLEPHDTIYLQDTARPLAVVPVTVMAGGVPGVRLGGYPEGGYTGYYPAVPLRLIYGYSGINRFIRPFD